MIKFCTIYISYFNTTGSMYSTNHFWAGLNIHVAPSNFRQCNMAKWNTCKNGRFPCLPCKLTKNLIHALGTDKHFNKPDLLLVYLPAARNSYISDFSWHFADSVYLCPSLQNNIYSKAEINNLLWLWLFLTDAASLASSSHVLRKSWK